MILEDTEIKKLTFSGHDSFQCRQLWLKKGYDFVVDAKNFNDEDSVIKLGVGKNMVSSIRFWLKAFNIVDSKDIPTEFGKRLFDNEVGYDPFLEDEASLWLLHYQLIKTDFSSIYSIIFNELRKEKLHFNQKTFINYMRRIAESNSDLSFNENTLGKDFLVFTNMYKSEIDSKNIEDSFSGILSELEIIQLREKSFYIENSERDTFSSEVFLFSILDNPNYGDSISLSSLEFGVNSPGSIFSLNRSGMMNKITEIVSKFKDITFVDHAGVKELQFKNKPDGYKILDQYYGK